MGRPRMTPEHRWERELRLWTAAEMNMMHTEPSKPLLQITLDTQNHATQLMHRLNSARSQTRPIGSKHPVWDDMVVRRADNRIEIHWRDAFDWSAVTDGNGNPITDEQVRQYSIQKRHEQQHLRNTLERGGTLDPQGPHKFDPNKPLIDE